MEVTPFERCEGIHESSSSQFSEYRRVYLTLAFFATQPQSAISVTQIINVRSKSTVSDSTQSVQVNAHLHERELHLRSELTHALIELSEESDRPLCLFIDAYERLIETDPELDGWFWGEVILGIMKAFQKPLLVVTCGWEHPKNDAIVPFSHPLLLTDFNSAQVRSYLEKLEVITNDSESSLSEQDELVTAFYDLTKGHPLVLGLAVTYFKQLNRRERNAQILRAHTSLIDERARVEFLNNRLLLRLKEPDRTLLERGPILRYFDQATLEALLKVETEYTTLSISKLDDRTYDHFLTYPFINYDAISQSASHLIQPTFHEVVRHIQLETLRRLHPKTKEQLHRKMIDYYNGIIKTEQERSATYREVDLHNTNEVAFTQSDYTKSVVEMPEKEFGASLERLYHTLQVEELRDTAFEEWNKLIKTMLNSWRHRQAGLLLEIFRQLMEEDESFLNISGNPYGLYLLDFARFLTQEARWKEAQDRLEEAIEIFEQVGDLAAISVSLNNIGTIYQNQSQLDKALSFYERALALEEQVSGLANVATSLNNIGMVYKEQGLLDKALSYLERSLVFREQVGDPAYIAASLNNIGVIYRDLRQLDEALSYSERALALREHVGDPANIAISLNNIGVIYIGQRQLDKALSYLERALTLREQVGNLTYIADSLTYISSI